MRCLGQNRSCQQVAADASDRPCSRNYLINKGQGIQVTCSSSSTFFYILKPVPFRSYSSSESTLSSSL